MTLLGNRFSIDEVINPDNCPEKYSGTDLMTKEWVIITVHDLRVEEEPRQSILEGCSLRHQSACETRAVHEEGHQITVVTERPPTDLFTITGMKKHFRKPWEEKILATILAKVTSVLKYAQEKGLHHGNIRPNTIYTDTEASVVKLSDFTAFKQIPPVKSINNPELRNQYISPEFRSNPRGSNPHKNDVFALGMTMLFLAQLDLYNSSITQDTLNELLRKLQYSPEFVRIITRMLEFDHTVRPDAKELAELIEAQWPEFRQFFSVPKFCSACGSMYPAHACLCTYPLSLVCSDCLNAQHKGNCHYEITAIMMEQIKSKDDFSRIRDNLAVLRRVSQSLAESLAELEKCMEDFRTKVQDYMDAINSEATKTYEELWSLKVRAELFKKDIDSNFQLKIMELSTDQAQSIASVETPYFSHAPLRCSNSCPIVNFSELISALEAASAPLAFPFFRGSQLVVYRLSDANQSIVQQQVELPATFDTTARFLFISRTELFGCGGQCSPNHSFRLRIDNGELKDMQDTIDPREAAGLALCGGRVYAFGGKFARTSAEVHSIASRVAPAQLREMNCPRLNFNPCVFSSLIYLLGQKIETYNPSTSTYCELTTVSCPFDTGTIVVFDERLYIFTNKFAAFGALKNTHTLCRCDQNIVKFLSNPAPLLQGNTLYLLNASSPSVLRLQLGRLVTKSDPLVML